MSTVNTLYLVRHGENLANLTKEFSCRKVDYPLTLKGRLQAEQTGEYFSRRKVDAVYTSPLLRAQETGQLIATRLGLEAVILEEFRELDVGRLEDMGSSPEGWEIHFRVIQDWMSGKPESRFPGGEDYHTALRRLRAGIERVMAGRSGQTVLVVGHGGLFATGLLDLCPGADSSLLWNKENHNCSISEMTMRRLDGRWVGDLIRWADISHLTGDAADLVSGIPGRNPSG